MSSPGPARFSATTIPRQLIRRELASDMRDLGEVNAARQLDEGTLARYRQILGDDHPGTLEGIETLAADHFAAGELSASHDLYAQAFADYCRVLGDDHPHTLRTARWLDDTRQTPHIAKNQ